MVGVAVLQNGKDFATFSWTVQSYVVNVILTFERVADTRKSILSKRDARNLWSELLSEGFTPCRTT